MIINIDVTLMFVVTEFDLKCLAAF